MTTRRPLRKALAEALHAAGCCDEPHEPGEAFTVAADSILDMTTAEPYGSDMKCFACGAYLVETTAPFRGHNERCGWYWLWRIRQVNER